MTSIAIKIFVQKFEFKINSLVESLFLKNELRASKNILTELFQQSKVSFENHHTDETLKRCDDTRDWNRQISDGRLESLMAKILYVQGKPREALDFVNLNVNNERIPTLSFYILAGDIANANELPGRAAHFYSEAEKSGPQVAFAMGNENPAFRKELLKKAASLAASDATFDKVETANIFMRYALALEIDDQPLSLQYLQQAYELVPDSEQRKADLLERILRLKSQLPSTASSEANPTESDKSLINSRYTEAKLAETSGRNDAYSYWLTLADETSKANDSANAIKYAEHAISLLPRSFSPIEYRVPIPHDSELTESLVKNGDYIDAEKIFIDVFNKIKNIDGKGSFSAAQQGAQLVLFYVEHNRDVDAIRTLSQLTTDCPRALEIGWPENALSELQRAQQQLFKKNRGEVALQICQQLLKGKRQNFEADDERVAETLVKLAATEKALKKDADAERHLSEASQIYKLYFLDPATHARKQFGTLLASFEINGYVDNRLDRETPGFFPDTLLPKSEQIDELQKHYDHVRIATPYSAEAQMDLNSLVYLGTELEKWSIVANAATARLAMFEHEPDQLAGRQVGCCITEEYRLNFYQRAIEANLHLGRKQDAADLVARAEAHFTAPSFHEMCRLSKLAYDCDDLAKSEKFAFKAENLMDNETWEFKDLVKLWRALGRENQAVEVEVKAKKIEDEDEARMQALNKGAFNNFNI